MLLNINSEQIPQTDSSKPERHAAKIRKPKADPLCRLSTAFFALCRLPLVWATVC
jgi:hypothetical protein